jgi:hypothetical protein
MPKLDAYDALKVMSGTKSRKKEGSLETVLGCQTWSLPTTKISYAGCFSCNSTLEEYDFSDKQYQSAFVAAYLETYFE